MDWSTVALLVAEQAGLPALLLSRRGELLLMAPAAERALGLTFDNVGGNWLDRYVPAHAVPSARWRLEKALDGALRKLDLPLRTGGGLALAHFDARPVGRDGEAGLLLVLERLATVAPAETPDDYDYEVGKIASGVYGLKKLLRLGVESQTMQGACFEVLHARSAPCEGCPLLVREPGKRATTVRSGRSSNDFVITTASVGSDTDEARVSVRTLPMSSLTAVLQAELDELASRALLSKRERSVFVHLMDGRGVEEIASELKISPRTVKFHQANVLQKLGADSRTDLLRLVF